MLTRPKPVPPARSLRARALMATRCRAQEKCRQMTLLPVRPPSPVPLLPLLTSPTAVPFLSPPPSTTLPYCPPSLLLPAGPALVAPPLPLAPHPSSLAPHPSPLAPSPLALALPPGGSSELSLAVVVYVWRRGQAALTPTFRWRGGTDMRMTRLI